MHSLSTVIIIFKYTRISHLKYTVFVCILNIYNVKFLNHEIITLLIILHFIYIITAMIIYIIYIVYIYMRFLYNIYICK